MRRRRALWLVVLTAALVLLLALLFAVQQQGTGQGRAYSSLPDLPPGMVVGVSSASTT